MDASTITVNLNINAADMSAELAATYIAEVMAGLTVNLGTPAAASAGTPAHIVGIDKQLGRLTDFAPMFAPRVKKLHNDLVALGYVPTLPKSQNDKPPSYISYLDSKGDNLGNLNSKTFIVMRGYLRDSLVQDFHWDANDRYAYCELVSDEAVEAVARVAVSEKK